VGALAHYLEDEGIPTTQISLIREHTEFIRPPRALWVPFELGRPLGRPDDPDLQNKVLMSALMLLEAAEGPLLANFPDGDETPSSVVAPESAVWACPINLKSASVPETDSEKLLSAFKREIASLRPWYDLSFERRGRTALGLFNPDTASNLLASYASGKPTEIPIEDLSLAVALRLAAHDLKAFYFEAAIARPGTALPDSATFNKWFWNETAAGQLLKDVKERCMNDADKSVRMTGAMLLVPLGQT
jgi:hypothetical protein